VAVSVEYDDLPSQVGEGQILAAGVEPSILTGQLRGANACT
jgi:hypothetical protein